MNIVVSGFPRHRSSLIVNGLAEQFNLTKPNNLWGETHKFNEDYTTWINKDNSVFKLWPFSNVHYSDIIRQPNNTIVFTYSEDLVLFAAKLFRSHVTKDWGIELRDKQPISYIDNAEKFEAIVPHIKMCCDNLVNCMMDKQIILKSVFVKDDQVSAHIQSSIDPAVVAYLKSLPTFAKQSISTYISEGKQEFYEQVYSRIGHRL